MCEASLSGGAPAGLNTRTSFELYDAMADTDDADVDMHAFGAGIAPEAATEVLVRRALRRLRR